MIRSRPRRSRFGTAPANFTVLLTAAIFAIRKRTALSMRHLCPVAEVTIPAGRLESELIDETRYRFEVGRTAWIVLQIVPQFHNVIGDAAAARMAIFVTTNFFQQLDACNDAIGMFNEKLHCNEVMCRQCDRDSVASHLHFPVVHDDVAKTDLTHYGRRVAVTQSHLQPRQSSRGLRGLVM